MRPKASSTNSAQPGTFPYGRGIRKDMYRGRLWTMRQYAGFGTAAESNARYRYLLERGQTGLSVAFDLPDAARLRFRCRAGTRRGWQGRRRNRFDRRYGNAASTAIPLERVTVSMTINAPAAILLALFLAVARRRGIPFRQLGGTVQNDVLKEYAARGTYIYPPKSSMRLVTDVMSYCAREVPQWNAISISGYHIREAGSTAVEEIAFTLSNGKAYLAAPPAKPASRWKKSRRAFRFFGTRTTTSSKRSPSSAPRAISGRRSSATSFGCNDPRSQMLRFHTQTGGSTLTAQEPDNNVVRVTLQALAAVLGGTQSLHTNGKDEALALADRTERESRAAHAADHRLRVRRCRRRRSLGRFLLRGIAHQRVDRTRGRAHRGSRRDGRQHRGDRERLDAGRASPTRPMPRNRLSNAAKRSSSASIVSRKPTMPTRRSHCNGSTNASKASKSNACERFVSRATEPPWPRRLDAVRARGRGNDNLMPLFVDAVDAGPRSARFATFCATSLECIRRPRSSWPDGIDHVAIVVKDLDATLRALHADARL